MNPESFFENFFLLAESPNGIKKLREMILQMAVQGKLVPQNPDDEPAEMLLERIEAKKETLLKEGKFKRSKPLTVTEYDNCVSIIPKGWVAEKLGNICIIQAGGTPSRHNKDYWTEGTIPWLKIGDLKKKYVSEASELITEKGLRNSSATIFPPGTILFTIFASIGKVGILNFESAFNQAIAGLQVYDNSIDIEYLYYYLTSLNNYYCGICRGLAQKNINQSMLKETVILIPPLDEQKRIVAKVNQLMELCDQLESLQQKKHESRIHLNNTALNRMLDAGSPEKFAEHWRLVCENFGLLYEDLENVEKLRQAILQLAVMGKLVEQDVGDEPAEVLLERIRAEKERLVKEGELKKIKELPKITRGDAPYDVPKNWKWTRLGSISRVIEYGTSHKASVSNSGVPVLRMNNINQGKVSYDNIKYVPNSIKDIPRLFLKQNDILFNRTNSYELVGKSGIFKQNDNEYTFASYLIRISLFTEYAIPDFINIAMNSSYFRETQIEPEITQQCGQANFNGTKLSYSLIPFPPFEEQKRIVSKVDQLMELCDRLEAGIRQAQEDGQKLMEVAVSGLLASCD